MAGGHRRTDLPNRPPLAGQSRLVWVNDAGRIVGEDHPNASLTDEQVEQIRDLREFEGLTYAQIADRIGVALAKSTMSDICRYRRRVATRVRCKRVRITDQGSG